MNERVAGSQTGLFLAVWFASSVHVGCTHPAQHADPAPAVVPSAVPTPTTVSVADAGAPEAVPAAVTSLESKSLPLAGASEAAFLDYVTQSRGKVWVPFVSGSNGIVDVLDVTRGEFARIDGFKTVTREARGKTRVMGPSSVAVGDGVAYVGNRGASEICVVDATKLKIGQCLKLSTPPDGVAYASSAQEVWVTTPQEHSIAVLDASKKDALKPKTIIKTDGDPEGYAIDEARGLFFTNLEDKNKTLAIDIKTHQVSATWSPNCGADGPRGLVVDSQRRFVIVACTDHLQVLDAAHDGALLGKLDTGAGVDNIDFADALVYTAAGKAARFTIARVDDHGALSVVASASTSDGARNAVADADGKGYVVDGKNGRVLIFERPRKDKP